MLWPPVMAAARARSRWSLRAKPGPRCWARRAADTAADRVVGVLPVAPYRQWVLTFPFEVRFLLAVDGAFLTEMLSAFMRTLFAWMRVRARRIGISKGEPGSVTPADRTVHRTVLPMLGLGSPSHRTRGPDPALRRCTQPQSRGLDPGTVTDGTVAVTDAGGVPHLVMLQVFYGNYSHLVNVKLLQDWAQGHGLHRHRPAPPGLVGRGRAGADPRLRLLDKGGPGGGGSPRGPGADPRGSPGGLPRPRPGGPPRGRLPASGRAADPPRRARRAAARGWRGWPCWPWPCGGGPCGQRLQRPGTFSGKAKANQTAATMRP